MNCNVIATGSGGNAVVLDGRIMVDCGVPFCKLGPFLRDLGVVFLTHRHGDHFKENTVQRLAKERPTLRWSMGEHMLPLADGVIPARCIDILEPGQEYGYKLPDGTLLVRPVLLRHDVPNFGYHFTFRSDSEHFFRIFYATDTGTLDGIEAKGYDLYLVEANYEEAELQAREADKLAAGEFSYESRAALNHLSAEQARGWLAANAWPQSRVIWLHQHKVRK